MKEQIPHKLRTIKNYNLDCLDDSLVCGKFEIPTFYAANVIPQRLIGFNQVLSWKGSRKNIGVHFYLDDYQFERVWNCPKYYADKLRGFECVLTPDFSLYTDMPFIMQGWNHYRKMLIGQVFSNMGLNVIPSIGWSLPASYQFCFDGVPTRATIAVSTIGIPKSAYRVKIWTEGMAEAVQRLKPRQILAYGEPLPFDPAGAEVVWFRSEHLDRMRKIRRKGNGPRTNFLVQNPRLVYYVASMMGSQEGPDGGRTASQNSTNRRVFFTTSAICPSWKSGLHLQDALLTPDSLGTAPMSLPSAMSF